MTGIMGYIQIQKIDVKLPLYRTTDSKVLQYGVGHLSGTSLPVGGEEQSLRTVRPPRASAGKAVYRS